MTTYYIEIGKSRQRKRKFWESGGIEKKTERGELKCQRTKNTRAVRYRIENEENMAMQIFCMPEVGKYFTPFLLSFNKLTNLRLKIIILTKFVKILCFCPILEIFGQFFFCKFFFTER